MLFEEWLEETLQSFKNSPNSIKIFDIIREKVIVLFKDQNFEQLIACSEDSVSSYCGISFKKDQLLYHCSDCALDETCVLCEKCFNFDVHKDHNYWYTIGTNNSGSCDCGEDDSWRNDLKCSHHPSTPKGEISNILSKNVEFLRNLLRPVLSFVFESFYQYGESRNEIRAEECVLILYNDENHSFDDVIDILSTEIEVSVKDAEAFATLVDTKGFAPILISSAATCARLNRKFKTLTTSVEEFRTAFKMILSTEIVAYLSEKCSISSNLRRVFVDLFLEEFAGASDQNKNNNLGIFFCYDHLLWKSVRLNFNEILNSCNAIDQESKKDIALTYCKNYNKIFEAFLKEKRESHLSVTNFSVQIFTLIPVAEYCLENSGILADFFEKMIEILEPGFNPSAGLDFAKLRGFNYQKFSVLTHDALHITRNARRDSLKIPNLKKTLDTFMYLLSLLTHMQGHFIKTGDHVTYDRDNYDNANYMCFELQQIAQELARLSIGNCALASIWSLFDKHIDQKPSLCKLLINNSEENPITPLFKSRKRCSFFGSMAWFYAMVVREAIKRGGDLNVPSKIVKCFAIDSLNRILFSAEVRSGLWVRNGLIIRQQEYFYSSTVCHNLTYFQDLYNCIIGSRLIDRIPFIEIIRKYSCVIDYLQNQEQMGPIIDQFMIIFINCCSSGPIELDSDQILINSLCTEGLTKSSLVKILPELVIEGAEFRENLLKMSKLTTVNVIGVDAKLEITKHYMDQFDPFYWAFSMNFRLKAWSTFKEKRRLHSDILYELFMKKYPMPAEITKEADFLVEMLLNFADSASTDQEFSLEMLLILLKAITNITRDQECLERISKCIEKFKLKKNIPEGMLKFLASICPASQDVELAHVDSGIEVLHKANRSNILASFKRQRETFIAEPQVAFEEDDLSCVVCSESGCGANDESFLSVPFQLTESSLMIHDCKKGCFIRGCHHLIHNTCFNSLPGKDFKKCTLCNSVIEYIFPIFSESQYKGPKELILSEQTNITITLKHMSALNQTGTVLYEKYILGLACSLVYICEKAESIEALPLHQILTFTDTSRSLLGSIRQADVNVFDLQFIIKLLDEQVIQITQVEALQIIIPSIIYFLIGKISLDDFGCIYKKVLSLSSKTDHLNMALNLFMNESLSKDEVIKCPFEYVPISDDINSVTFNMDLLRLPRRHDLFLKEYLTKKCVNCKTVPRSGAVCIICGTLVCVGQQCCRSSSGKFGECYTHRKSCSGIVGIFFLIRSCALLIISESIGTIVPAPYVNSYGEHDFDLSSASALFLNTQLYDGKLTELWRNFELRDFILRNMDNSRINASSWSLL